VRRPPSFLRRPAAVTRVGKILFSGNGLIAPRPCGDHAWREGVQLLRRQIMTANGSAGAATAPGRAFFCAAREEALSRISGRNLWKRPGLRWIGRDWLRFAKVAAPRRGRHIGIRSYK